MTESKVIWIDDDLSHKKDADLLAEKSADLKITFFHPKEFVVEEMPVDLFLLDDRLYQHENAKNEKSNARGFTLAANIRFSFPEIPIYIFTKDFFDQGIFGVLSQASESFVDEKIYYKDVQRRGVEILLNDSLDYKKIRSVEKLNLQQLLNLLNPPEDIVDELKNALPEALRDGLRPADDQGKSEGNSLFYGKWIKKSLLTYSGFIYDSLFAATSVGLTEKMFLEIQDFAPALYDGLFSKSRKPLWWNRKLRSILMTKAQKALDNKAIGNPFALAEKIFNLKENEILKCAVCKEKYPETVAFNKDDPNDRQPVHFSCSAVDYTKENKLFFEELRYFKYED
ncbi:MAG: hypothetical protein ACBZ72_07995 [Candidatus Bathyarchaeia archaeon]